MRGNGTQQNFESAGEALKRILRRERERTTRPAFARDLADFGAIVPPPARGLRADKARRARP